MINRKKHPSASLLSCALRLLPSGVWPKPSALRHLPSVFNFLIATLCLLAWSLTPLFAATPSFTVDDASPNAFGHPAPNLSPEHKRSFFVGNSFFKQNWVIAPSSTADRDGLGPHFNARSCSTCHLKDGRGAPPNDREEMVSLILRLSIPGEIDPHQGVRPEPTYGTQLQNFAIPNYTPKGRPIVSYEEITGQFPDGETYQLQKPLYAIHNLSKGPLHAQTLISPRIAPQVIGMGLLEAIPEAAIVALADPHDTNNDGISGRTNRVWDIASNAPRLGRFGWKANAPSILQQTAAAFAGDMGITSHLFPEDETKMPHGQTNAESGRQRTGLSAEALTHAESHPDQSSLHNDSITEISAQTLQHVVLYTQTLAVPNRRNPNSPEVLQGQALFEKIGCTACHHPQFTTGPYASVPEFENQIIQPYTDLLLHDMGPDLADNRPDFEATGQEWRTPPLWGIGLVRVVNGHSNYLHDGRARNIQEAILWHAGEAEASKVRYTKLPREERKAILQFLESL